MELFEKTYPDMPAAVAGLQEWATGVANLSRGAAVVDAVDPTSITVQIGRRRHWLRYSPPDLRPHFARPAPNGDLLIVVQDSDEKGLPIIEKVAGAFSGEFMGAIKEAMGAVGQFFDGVDTETSDQWIAMLTSLAKNLGKLAGVAVVAGAVFSGMLVATTAVANTSVSAMIGAFQGFVNFIGEMVSSVSNWFDDLSAMLGAKGRTLPEKMLMIGKHMVEGLTKGIKAVAFAPVDAVMSIGGDTLRAMKESLGIKSPSKEMAALGRFAGKGFEEGLLATLPKVERAATRVTGAVLTPAVNVARIVPPRPMEAALSRQLGLARSLHRGERGAAGRRQVLTTQERVARSIEQSVTTSQSEVTIRDETGRAEVTKKPKRGGAKLRLEHTGRF